MNRRLLANGFTLIEIIAVLVILGIVSAIALSRVSGGNYSLQAQTKVLKSHIRFCQIKALSDIDGVNGTGGVTNSWGLNFPNNHSYILTSNGNSASISLPGDQSNTHEMAGTGVTFSSLPSPMTFDEFGSHGSSDITITLTKDSSSQSITILGSTGYVP